MIDSCIEPMEIIYWTFIIIATSFSIYLFIVTIKTVKTHTTRSAERYIPLIEIEFMSSVVPEMKWFERIFNFQFYSSVSHLPEKLK